MTKISQVVAASKPLSESEHVVHLRKNISDLESDNRKLRERLGSQKELADCIAAAVVASKPYPPFHIKSSKNRVTVVPTLEFSDWHIGEVVKADEVEGFNEYSYAIAERRIFQIVEDFIKWVGVQRACYNVDHCVVIAKGDFVSGDIHDELKATNEFPLPVQAAKAGLLLGEVLHRLSPNFHTMEVREVGADNHGRLQKKPQAKQKAANNMTFLVYTIANTFLARCNNITFHEDPGMKQLFDINGQKFLAEHGDTVKAWMGIPYYGIERARGREANRRMFHDRGFNYLSVGHWHVPGLVSGNVIINGSLSGTSELDHSCGRHALPAQVAYLVHRQHGIFNFTPFVAK